MAELDWDGLAKRVEAHAATLDERARFRYLEYVRHLAVMAGLLGVAHREADEIRRREGAE